MLPAQLPDGGWSRFVEVHWEKQPIVCPAIVAKRDALSRMLFQACVSAAVHGRPLDGSNSDGPSMPMWRFVASRPAHKNAPRPLPRRTDGGFEDYLARAASETRSRDVTFIVNDAQGASAPLFDCGSGFLSGLSKFLGIPLETDCVVFATRSRVSALGIHRDPYSNFLFVVEGEKTFLLWPRDAVPGTPVEVPVSMMPAMRACAQRVRLKAGDMLYMPSGWYHCALQDGFSVHLSIIVGAGGEHVTQTFLWRELRNVFRDCFNGSGGKSFVADEGMTIARLPDSITVPFREGLAKTRTAEEAVRSALLRLQSASGFTVSPPERPHRALKPSDWVAGRTSHLRMMVHGSQLIVAACGHVHRVPAHPLLVAMMETLGSGEPVQVRELLRRFSGSGEIAGEQILLDRQWILMFLRILCRARWLDVVRRRRRAG